MPEPDSFSYKAQGAEAWIYHMGKHVTTLRGRRAADFLVKVAPLDAAGRQHLMARFTGQYKRGNERR